MQEVTIRLRFNNACLGHVRRPTRDKKNVIFRMPKDGNNAIIFLPSWWRDGLRYAAKVLGRYHREVDRVAWDPIIDGRVTEWKRFIINDGKRGGYSLHEAFRPGEIVGVNAVLPPGLSCDAFAELLQVVGTYKGISPFHDSGETYGTFEVISVLPTIRTRRSVEQPSEAMVDET